MAAEQAQGKVEASVFAIITAFTSGLDVFRKLRERRGRRKKTKKNHCSRSHSTTTTAALEPSDDELQLSNSLQRGSVEIQDRYRLNRRQIGDKFAQGDSIAHASLTEVLLKLNTGLVAIISSFLCHGKNESNLDFRSLAHLADCSRSEAVDALDQLSQRLSHSQINLESSRRRPHCCPNCRSQKHADCGSVMDLKGATVAKKPSLVAVKQQAANGGSAAPPSSTKAPKQKGSQSRLVMVRPHKSSRLKTSSSTSAIQTQSSASGKSPWPRSRSPSPPSRPDAAATTAAAQKPPPPLPRLHKLAKKNAIRSMTSLAAEPIPEHALPASPPLHLSLMPPPPYPGLPTHTAANRLDGNTKANTTTSRNYRNAEIPRNGSTAGPPKPPKIPLTSHQHRKQEERNLHHTPSSNLLPYSPYPAAQHPLPTSQRSHPRLRPQRHSSMPPIPLASVDVSSPPSSSSSQSAQQAHVKSPSSKPSKPQQQPEPQHHHHHQNAAAPTTNRNPTSDMHTRPSNHSTDLTIPPCPLAPPPPAPPRRRTTVPVPASIYSFTSDSTKLGEIPMSRWAAGPWDAERAARLNAEAGWGGGTNGNAGSRIAEVEARGSGRGGGAGDEKGEGVVVVVVADAKKKRSGRGRLGALWPWGSSGSGSGSGSDREKERKAKV